MNILYRPFDPDQLSVRSAAFYRLQNFHWKLYRCEATF